MSKFTYRRQSRNVCIEPNAGRQVYDYYNGLLEADEVKAFELHLIQCPKCESTVLELDAIMHTLIDQLDFGAMIESQTTRKTPFASWLSRRSKH